jgi:signal transduction histidine kinase
MRRPRRTVRTRLTLLYAVPFLISGVFLLGIPILQTSQSVPADGRGGLVPAPDMTPEEHHLQQLIWASAVGLAVMVLVSLGLGWLIAGRFLRPLRTITATARDISASNLHRRLGRTGRNDEFTELAATLDDLFGRLEASFESQRHFVANASHELRTPLTAERALLQVALADPEATVDSLRAAGQEALALGRAQERLIEALLTLASSERGLERREPFDLADIAGHVVTSRTPDARRRGIQVDTGLGAAPASGDPSLVESLVTNLLDNALRHNRPGGRVELSTTTVDGQARITVRNTGPVVPPDELARLFEPFQRLGRQRVGDGHGLGLAIVRAIAGVHGATLRSRPNHDGGLTVEVTWPPSSSTSQ